MKRIFLISIAFLTVFMIGCTEQKFEIHKEINPKVKIMEDGDISVEYKLGDILVLDEFDGGKIGDAVQQYIIENQENLKLGLVITHADSFPFPYKIFTYYLDKNEICSNSNVIKAKVLMENEYSIGSFIWKVKNGEKVHTKVLEQKTDTGLKKL